MRKGLLVAVMALVLGIGMLLGSLLTPAARADNPAAEIGRFQVTAIAVPGSETIAILLDTKSGGSWNLTKTSGAWNSLGLSNK